MIIFLHGFNSVGRGVKAQMLEDYFPDLVHAPDYPVHDPDRAIPFLQTFIETSLAGNDTGNSLLLIGSSLGGFYANWLAVKYKTKCVMINPSTHPWLTLQQCLGENVNYYTKHTYELTQDMLNAMSEFVLSDCADGTPRLVLLDADDEVLDYSVARDQFEYCAEVIVYEGGSHRFDHMPEALVEIDRMYSF